MLADRSPIQEEGPKMTNDSLSNTYGSAQGGAAATDASSSPTNDLRGDVSALASDAGDAGRRVADVAKDETRSVASETRRQASRFMGQVGDELSSQAASQQARVAEGLQAMGSEFSEMARSASGSGYASELVRGAGERADAVARWLEVRDPRSVLEEVKGFARRRPGVFLAIAVGAGVLAGRLTRALAEPSDGSSPSGRITPQRGRELDEAAFDAPAVPPVAEVPPMSSTTIGAATGGGVPATAQRQAGASASVPPTETGMPTRAGGL